jgi:phage terminase large subunit
MKIFLELMPDGEGEWQETRKTFLHNNQHQTIFRHLDITDPRVSGHIKSMNLSSAFIDEATEISEETYFLITGRVRRKNTKRRIIRLASNPAGKDWVWRHFFDPNRKEHLQKNLGISMSTFDNPHLPEDIVASWKATYPKDWYDRYLLGHFSDFSDLVYKEFTEATHTWNSMEGQVFFGGSSLPPPEWPVIVGVDIGSDIDPWSICLVSVAPDGRLFQFDEVYGRNLLIADIADEMHQKLRGNHRPDIAYDYANRQAALELAECDIHGQPAIKEIQPGLFKVAQYFHIDPRLQHPFLDKLGSPRYFIASHCSNTITEVSNYKYAKDRAGTTLNEPAHENSHSPDAIRYAIHTFRPLPEKMKVPEKWENPALDRMSSMYWRDIAQQEKRIKQKMSLDSGWKRPAAVRFQRPRGVLR